MKIHRGDLLPDLVLGITDDGEPVDFTVASSIHVIGIRNRVVIFNRAAVGDAAGNVTMAWQPTDTASTGQIRLQVRVVWPGNKPQTFTVEEDIDVLPSYHVGV